MSPYRFIPLETSIAEKVRSTLRDDAGNQLSAWTSDSDGAPCRHCLRTTQRGERLILFAYRPFDESGPYAELGPIFVHAETCDRYDEHAGLPGDFATRPLTLRSYGATERGSLSIVDAVVAPPGEAETALERLFADGRAAFVHARNPAWGCFDFIVERAR
jgi:hypothetical protein